MANPSDCNHNADPLKLVREGTRQDQRMPTALEPAYAPVDGRIIADRLVFAQDYAELLKYYDVNNAVSGNWKPFFGRDIAAQLAIVAAEDIESYKTRIKACFDYLSQKDNLSSQNVDRLRDRFGLLYGYIATLAQQLDLLKESLADDAALTGTLRNLIQGQLQPSLEILIKYYQAGKTLTLVNDSVPSPDEYILRSKVVSFSSVLSSGLSTDWTKGDTWSNYSAPKPGDGLIVYGDASAPAELKIYHCATHPLFKSIFDAFLKVFARLISEAKVALDDALTKSDKHEPHYALFLAFVRLFEHIRDKANTLTARHLDFYYRKILGLKEKPAEPGQVHLLIELAKQAAVHDFAEGELFKAGKDDAKRDAYFANDRDFVANQAKIAALKTVYRHGNEQITAQDTRIHQGRIFASPVANSDDGLGADLLSDDQSWHPFYNKTYIDGELSEIRMPEAEVGFAIASHYLLMAEGQRQITAKFNYSGVVGADDNDYGHYIRCFLTTAKGWVEISDFSFTRSNDGVAPTLTLTLTVSGDVAPITPYTSKTHGYTFDTDLPVLLVKLRQYDASGNNNEKSAYPLFQQTEITRIELGVEVQNLKSLAVSNDFGTVDTSKPFQPFGPSPRTGNTLVIGSREVFQKKLSNASVQFTGLPSQQTQPPVTGTPPPSFRGKQHMYEILGDYMSERMPGIRHEEPPSPTSPSISVDYLKEGEWSQTAVTGVNVNAADFSPTITLDTVAAGMFQDEPDFGANEYYGTSSRHGFIRLILNGDIGQDAYQVNLLNFLADPKLPNPGPPPVGPSTCSVSISYQADTALKLDSAKADSFSVRMGRYFHLAPFGTAEQHAHLNSSRKVFLLPQFVSPTPGASPQNEASEFYIGIAGLQPPQNLSLLFQVSDGTANPLARKPKPHIEWSYLRNNEWADFAANEVQDGTDELLNSGIVTFAVPREASDKNSILPSGAIWIRAAVKESSDAICRLRKVAAQALKATFTDKENSQNFSAKPLVAGTISKLAQPDSAVKAVTQPFPSFGGRGVELPAAFYTRISERLRHKDRAVALWDYEHLILEAFPQIYKIKCLNHTQCDVGEDGSDIYRELAPGHVTIVTIPNVEQHNLRDPLRPYTSLGLLEEIKQFVEKRASGFVNVHVKNPIFEEVQASFNVQLRDGFDESYSVKTLQQAIVRFLSPWAFPGNATPTFGGKIYKSVLINFIEDQPYVDYVTDFRLFHDKDGLDLDEVEGATAMSILVSARNHDINIIRPEMQSASGETCPCEA